MVKYLLMKYYKINYVTEKVIRINIIIIDTSKLPLMRLSNTSHLKKIF